jgi:hypothetical protein
MKLVIKNTFIGQGLGDLGAFGFMDWLKDSKTGTLETGLEMIQ